MSPKKAYCRVCQVVSPSKIVRRPYCLLCWFSELVNRFCTYSSGVGPDSFTYPDPPPVIPAARVIKRKPRTLQ